MNYADLYRQATANTPSISIPDMMVDAFNKKNPLTADHVYDVILSRIKDFEDQLDDDHEVALMLTSFGQSITLSVTEIGYENPNILIFKGYIGNQHATLIQHMSQLNFLMLANPKAVPNEPPRRVIGFALSDEHDA